LSLCNGIRIFYIGLRYSFLSRYVDQETANLSEGTFSVFESNCHLLLPVYSLIGRGNPVKCLDQRHNKRTFRPIFRLSFFYVERQARKLRIPTFKVFWCDSTRESNPDLPTFNTKITKFYCLKNFKRTFQLKHELLITKVVIMLYIGDMDR